MSNLLLTSLFDVVKCQLLSSIPFFLFSSLFAGVTVRVTWIAVGGAVFFGFYDKAKHVLMKTKDKKYND